MLNIALHFILENKVNTFSIVPDKIDFPEAHFIAWSLKRQKTLSSSNVVITLTGCM